MSGSDAAFPEFVRVVLRRAENGKLGLAWVQRHEEHDFVVVGTTASAGEPFRAPRPLGPILGSFFFDVDAVVAPDGALQVIWERKADPTNDADRFLETRRLYADGSRGPLQTLSTDPRQRISRFFLGLDGEGRGAAVWTQFDIDAGIFDIWTSILR